MTEDSDVTNDHFELSSSSGSMQHQQHFTVVALTRRHGPKD